MKTRRSTDVRRSFYVRSTIVVIALVCAGAAEAQTSPGVVGEVRVHGNHTTPDADILGIVGDVVGKPATDQLIAEIEIKLERSGRFDGVEVRKRFRSIDNPDDILLMVVVDEFPGIDEFDITRGKVPGPMRRFWSSGMFMPILRSEDGYGFTYGGRVSFVDRLGPRSRVSVPLTWGGERQARVQVERSFQIGPDRARLRRVRHRPPREPALRDRRSARLARRARRIRAGALVAVRRGRPQGRRAVCGSSKTKCQAVGGDVTIDTRVDPAFPRNAIHATFGIDRVRFDAGRANQKKVDARGYVGLFGQTVLAVRGLSITTDRPLPIYEHNLLGGSANLRGYTPATRPATISPPPRPSFASR